MRPYEHVCCFQSKANFLIFYTINFDFLSFTCTCRTSCYDTLRKGIFIWLPKEEKMNGCDAFICDLIAVVTLKMSLQKIEFCHLFFCQLSGSVSFKKGPLFSRTKFNASSFRFN